MRIRMGAVLSAVLLSGCTAGNQGGASESPEAAPSVPREWDRALVIDPTTTTAGSIVALTFPHENLRGIAFSLTPWRGGSWGEPEFYVMATQDRRYAQGAAWWRADDDEGSGWVDVGVGGRGPDYLTVPDTAQPGSYLLCTANAKDKACVILEIGFGSGAGGAATFEARRPLEDATVCRRDASVQFTQ